MTFKAREVLGDCRVALALLEEEQDLQRWRVHWAAAVALIRAVGHVLHKVDGADPDVRRLCLRAYQSWKVDDLKHEIFWKFIDRERNNLLKECQSNVFPLDEVRLAIEVVAAPENGGAPKRLHHVGVIGENIYRPLMDGPWEGNDARDVLAEAIEWWERQLQCIDDELARIRDRSR